MNAEKYDGIIVGGGHNGLSQCGSSTHPGGGVSGIPGHNAAPEILKDWKQLLKK